MDTCFSRIKAAFHRVINVLAIIICAATLLVQLGIFDFYLVYYTSRIDEFILELEESYSNHGNNTINSTGKSEPDYIWCLWCLPDLCMLAVFIYAFVDARRRLAVQRERATTPDSSEAGVGGILPLGWITWLLYAILVAVKVVILFNRTAQFLPDSQWYGPNLLKTAVTLSSIVFLTLVLTHHDAPAGSEQEAFVDVISHSVTFDLMDTTAFIQILFIQESRVFLTFSLHKAILAIGCFNLVLPTVLLLGLSRTAFGREEESRKRLKLLHKVLYVTLINLPMLVIRMIIWHVHNEVVSVFLIKNVISLGSTFHVVYRMASNLNPPPPSLGPEDIPLQPSRANTQPTSAKQVEVESDKPATTATTSV